MFGTRDVDGRGELKPVSGWRLPASEAERIVSDQRETLGLRVVVWALLLAAMLIGSFAREAIDDMSLYVIESKSLFAVIAAEIALLVLYRRMRDHIWMSHGLKRIRARVPDDRAVAVRYTMKREGVVTGSDEGFVWLNDGTLYFKGLQSVWRLNRDDMPPVSMWPKGRRPRLAEGKPPTSLPMPHGGARGEMTLAPIDPYEDHATRRKFDAFYHELEAWLLAPPDGHIESLLPPVDLHPSLEHSRGTVAEIRIASVALIMLNGMMATVARLHMRQGGFVESAGLIASCIYFALMIVCGLHWLRTQDTVTIRQKLLKARRIDNVLYP